MNKKLKKGFSVFTSVLATLFFVLCMFALVVTITSKKDADGAMSIFGHQLRIVVSDSMEKCDQTDVSDYKIKSIPVKSMVFIELVPENEREAQEWYADLEVGDVLTFKYTYVKQETITHRIIDIEEKETGGYIITLEGDNKASGSTTLKQTIDTSIVGSTNYVVGKVTAKSTVLGHVVYAVMQPLGTALIIIVPCVAIIIMDVIKIVSVLGEGKKKKQQEEIEELKRQLNELQEKQDKTSGKEEN